MLPCARATTSGGAAVTWSIRELNRGVKVCYESIDGSGIEITDNIARGEREIEREDTPVKHTYTHTTFAFTRTAPYATVLRGDDATTRARS